MSNLNSYNHNKMGNDNTQKIGSFIGWAFTAFIIAGMLYGLYLKFS